MAICALLGIAIGSGAFAQTPISLKFDSDVGDIVLDEARGLVYVGLPWEDSIAFVSTRSFTVVRRLPVGPLPRGLDLAADGSRLYVALGGSGKIAMIDPDTLAQQDVLIADGLLGFQLWDVLELTPGVVVVSLSTEARFEVPWIGIAHLDEGGWVQPLDAQESFSSRPFLALSPDRQFLFVGEDAYPDNRGYSDKRITLIHLPTGTMPPFARRYWMDGDAAWHVVASADGTRVFLGNGDVVESREFASIGTITPGAHALSVDGTVLHAVSTSGTLERWNPQSLVKIDSAPLPCSFPYAWRLAVSADGADRIAAGGDRLCGLVAARSCSGPPALSAAPEPADGGSRRAARGLLGWQGADSSCPATFDVLLGTQNPPTTTVCSSARDRRCDPGPLVAGTTYYWRVSSTNGAGTTMGPVWSFVTSSPPPPPPFVARAEFEATAHDAVLDTARERVYVSLPDLDVVEAISTRTLQVVERIAVGPKPRGLDLSPNGDVLYVALDGTGELGRIDLESKAVSRIPFSAALHSYRAWDVAAAPDGRVFVSANDDSSHGDRLAYARPESGGAATTMTYGASTSFAPVLAVTSDGRRLIVAQPTLTPDPVKLYDMTFEDPPFIREERDDMYPWYYGGSLTVSPDGSRVFLHGGVVLDTDRLWPVGWLSHGPSVLNPEYGLKAFGNEPGIVWSASEPDRVTRWNADTYEFLDAFQVPCAFEKMAKLLILPDGGWLVVGDDLVCGRIQQTPCSGPPPVPSDPRPSDDLTSAQLWPKLSWSGSGDLSCPTRYTVRWGTDGTTPNVACEGTSHAACDLGTFLAPSTRYTWRVEATNDAGTVSSPTWSFTTVAAATPTPSVRAVRLPSYPMDVAVDPARKRVYVALPHPYHPVIAYLSTECGSLVGSYALPDRSYHFTLSRDGRHLYATLYDSKSLAVIDLETGAQRVVPLLNASDERSPNDVFEYQPGVLLVTMNGDPHWMFRVELGPPDSVIPLTSFWFLDFDGGQIDSAPGDPYIYTTTDFTPMISKIDPRRPGVTIVTSTFDIDALGSILPDASRIVTMSGRILRTGSLVEEARVTPGLSRPSASGDAVYIAKQAEGGSIEVWDSATWTLKRTIGLACPNIHSWLPINFFLALPDDMGWVVVQNQDACIVAYDPDFDGRLNGDDEVSPDADGDGAPDACDLCPSLSENIAADADEDRFGDACDTCPAASDPGQADADDDGDGDACDKCPAAANANQADYDGDDAGDACDNCPVYPNAGQDDFDQDGIGDVCEYGAGLADADRSGRVDGLDLARLGRAFGASCGETRFDATVDFDRNCVVDGSDLAALAARFGESAAASFSTGVESQKEAFITDVTVRPDEAWRTYQAHESPTGVRNSIL